VHEIGEGVVTLVEGFQGCEGGEGVVQEVEVVVGLDCMVDLVQTFVDLRISL
jgi:hypothetical protein